HGAEDLLARDSHRALDVAKDRGLDVVPARELRGSPPAADEPGSARDARLHVIEHALALAPGDQRSLAGGGIARIADHERARRRRDRRDHLVAALARDE